VVINELDFAVAVKNKPSNKQPLILQSPSKQTQFCGHRENESSSKQTDFAEMNPAINKH